MVIRAYIFLILLIPALTVPRHPNYELVNDAKCGLQGPRNRIINGMDASPGEFPWMVAFEVKRRTSNGSTIRERCGGSILNENYVLTAAHCVVDDDDGKVVNISMILPDCTRRGSITHSAKKIVAYPFYKLDHLDDMKPHDIALIRVDRPISFNDLVGPVCLEDGDLIGKMYVGENAQVSGFGTYKFDDNDWNKPICSNKLKKLTVQIQNDKDCYENLKPTLENKYWNLLETVYIKSMICVPTKVGDVDQLAFKGDSGSPLVIAKQVNSDTRSRFYQIGISMMTAVIVNETSATPMPRYASIYTRVSFYLRWILDHLEPGEKKPEETKPGGKRPRH